MMETTPGSLVSGVVGWTRPRKGAGMKQDAEPFVTDAVPTGTEGLDSEAPVPTLL